MNASAADSPNPSKAPTIMIGTLLLILSILCMCLFFYYENARLGRFGVPRMWAGGPCILGAAFFAINGTFILVKRRFSLGALLLALIASGVLSTSIQFYVTRNRETTTFRSEYAVQVEKQQEFIALSRQLMPAGRLEELARMAASDNWFVNENELSFTTRIGANIADKNKIVVFLDISYPKFFIPNGVGQGSFQSLYCELVHSYIFQKVSQSPVPHDAASDGGPIQDSSIVYELQRFHPDLPERERFWMGTGDHPLIRKHLLEWLRSHETNAGLIKHFDELIAQIK